MPAEYYYQLPQLKADKSNLVLGCLMGAAEAVECADIVERHPGLVLLITKDTHKALKLRDEIQHFSTHSVKIFWDGETDSCLPHQEMISERLANIYQLPSWKKGLFMMPVKTLMQKVCPIDFLASHAIFLNKGKQISLPTLRNHLDKTGYRHVKQVVEHGEYATSGTVFDLFPMGSNDPYRISFFQDAIHCLKIFDVDSQRTVNEVEQINVLPAQEFPIDATNFELFCLQWRQYFTGQRHPEHIDQPISNKILPVGMEYWQPLFLNKPLSSIFDYLPKNTLLITQDCQAAASIFWANLNRRYERLSVNNTMRPEKFWLNSEQLHKAMNKWPRITISVEPVPIKKGHINLPYVDLPDLTISHKKKAPLEKLANFIKKFTGIIIFSAENTGKREIMQKLLASIKINPMKITNLNEAHELGFYITVGAAEHGFINTAKQIALICEKDINDELVLQRNTQLKPIDPKLLISNLEDLLPGQLIVHLEHGIGRYQGLTTLEVGGILAEYLILIYAGNDKLYLPVLSLNYISRYSGASDESVTLNKLGSDVWTKAKQKAAETVCDVAAEQLAIHAQRRIKLSFAFKHNPIQYQLFCQGFPFETTVDQEHAINAVLSDMCRPIPMDRLVCGDVGFGKTEVAMRATFLAITNNKQVAVLVPTTLLAQQHLDNFRDRFANFPVKIEMLSRFRSSQEQKKIIQATANGTVNILIGTHQLLQNDIRWKGLGLLIVDEEHRFGVRHKELIKSMRANVDILTLTATPIPRTLNMAMIGLRDLSIIATPPSRRLSVKTVIHPYDELMVREAILREILRGGQLYYLFNDVKYIEQTKERLASLVPEASFVIAHGQMREKDLERVMTNFYHKRFNVLICTTIIETGIHIPNVNTIVIERADNFGLAQLHQLRGRVGRSYHQAYAYLLTTDLKKITVDAQKRLEAIAALESLSAGFALATHDLEMRGAGELLGEEQSGEITTIGFNLYQELLANAVEYLKQGKKPSLEDLTPPQQTEIDLRMPVLLPNDYIPDMNIRLSFYKKMTSAKTQHELNDCKIELIDNFGPLPDAVKNLLQITYLRMHAKILGIKRIEAHATGGVIEFSQHNQVKTNFLMSLIQNTPDVYRIDGPHKLQFVQPLVNDAERLSFVSKLIADFQSHKIE